MVVCCLLSFDLGGVGFFFLGFDGLCVCLMVAIMLVLLCCIVNIVVCTVWLDCFLAVGLQFSDVSVVLYLVLIAFGLGRFAFCFGF